jgi:hypothetical protein
LADFRAALRREQLRLLLGSIPVLIAAYFLVGQLGSFSENPAVVALVLLPLAIVAIVLARPLVRERRLVLGGGFLPFFVVYCTLFAVAAGTRVLEGRRVTLAGYEEQAPSNVLGLARLGDWHYLFVRDAPPANDLLVIRLPSFDSVPVFEARRTEASLIASAVGNQAKGIAFDYDVSQPSPADRALCFWIERAESAGVPVVFGYGVDDSVGQRIRRLPATELRPCLAPERLGTLIGLLESDHRVRMVPTAHLADTTLRSFSYRIAGLLAGGQRIRDPGLVQFVAPANGIPTLDGLPDERMGAALRDRFVVVGSSREGDIRDTPFGPLSGVNIHAMAAHSLRTGWFIRRVDPRWLLPVIFVMCYVLTLLQSRGGVRPLITGAALMAVAILVSAVLAIRAGLLWIDASYPLLAVGLLTGVLSGGARLQRGRLRAVAPAPAPLQPAGAAAVDTGPFHVFLSHNSSDKRSVIAVGEKLRARALRVWLDEWELVPGRPWQEAIEQVIESVQSAAVLVGPDGLGPWEEPEMRACLDQCVRRRMPVIPVLLPGAPEKPKLPLFLQQFTWVDLRSGFTDDGVDRLEWGITGVKPRR